MSAVSKALMPALSEARRLLGAGMKLCKMEPFSKRPEGLDWNKRPVTEIDPRATGYGLMLAANKLCSIDPDDATKANAGLRALGIDLARWMGAGVPTRSSRAGSGGRSTFAVEGDLSWITFAAGRQTFMELRADSPNLQDTIPGIVYRDKAGTLCTQRYATDRRLDDAPPLPDDLYAWWLKLSTDPDFLHDQQRRFVGALGLQPDLAGSVSRGENVKLLFSAPGYRQAFNAAYDIETMLERHGYLFDRRAQRWTYQGATGAPGIYPVPNKDGKLWRSDHGGDPLKGAFDAWTIFVKLDHHGDVEAAKRACEAAGIYVEVKLSPETEGVQLADFHAYMPMHSYIFAPSGELWPSSSINARLPVVVGEDGSKQRPAEWLDQHNAVEQMTWAPGEPQILEDRLISNGGWIERPGCRCFNLYRPPTVRPGDAAKAGPWLDHLRRVYPDDHEHLVRWFAHRVQRPQDKPNHAIVLGGGMGIGKDTILEPVKVAVGPWNFQDVSPAHLLGRFNGFVKSVVLRVSEARDLGDVDRYAFYDHMKVYTAAPPDILRCDEKNVREYAVPNVCGVIVTTNHKTDGLYLPPDDRRHYVAWSDLTRDQFPADYWNVLYRWYADGGHGHVAAYLTTLDLSDFDAKAPPPKTPAFYDIVDANRAPEDGELADILDQLGNPAAITLDLLADQARHTHEGFHAWLIDRKNRRQVPHRLESAGYVPIRNDADKRDGQWKVSGRRQTVYAARTLSVSDRHRAVGDLIRRWSR
jgi:hypothetical protein